MTENSLGTHPLDSRRRGFETLLAFATLAALLVYVPLETWSSFSGGLLNPFLPRGCGRNGADALGFDSLIARPVRRVARVALYSLCVGIGKCLASVFWANRQAREWRNTFFGNAELWTVGLSFLFCIVMFVALLVLVVLNRRREPGAN